MRSNNYGDILRSTREKHGISLREIARELHVREDIVQSLEDGDFSKIPPQGYSRNMVKSYARILGLDTRKITDMFLDSEYSYQIEKKRTSAQNLVNENRRRYPNNGSRYSGARTPREQIAISEQKRLEDQKSGRIPAVNSARSDSSTGLFGNRQMHSYGTKYNNTPRARREHSQATDPVRGGRGLQVNALDDLANGNDYATAKDRLEARQRARYESQIDSQKKPSNSSRSFRFSRRNKAEAESFDDLNRNPNPEQKTVSQRVNFSNMHVYNSGNKTFVPPKINIFLIGGIVVVLVVVLIFVLFFAGRQVSNSKLDMSDVNVTGLTDPEKVNSDSSNSSSDSNSSTSTENQTAPTKAVFEYKVTGTSQAYIEISIDGKKTLARNCKSGESGKYDVTGVLKFVTTSPSNVTITVDGATVTPVDQNKVGVYTYTVDFSQILKDWKTKNHQS